MFIGRIRCGIDALYVSRTSKTEVIYSDASTLTEKRAWRIETLAKLNSKCSAIKTRPAIQRILNDGLAGWFRHPSNDFKLDPLAYPADVRTVIYYQNDIGWHHLFLGRFATEWSEIQDVHFIRINQEAQDKKLKCTGQRWLAGSPH